MDYKKVLLAVAGKLYKKPEEEVTDLLKTEGSDEFDEEKTIKAFETWDKDKVSKIKGEAPKWSDAVNKANKEIWTKVETALKEKFEIESDLQGEELLSHISETLSQKSAETGGKPMTEEEIKSSPFVAQLVKDFNKKLADKDKEKEVAVKEVEGKFTRKERDDKVAKAALDRLEKIGEISNLPSDRSKADKQIQRLYIDEILKYDHEEKDGKFMPLDKDGKYLQDEHGYAMTFEDFTEKIAKDNFEFKKATDRSIPESSKQQHVTKEQAEEIYTGKEPSSSKEYAEINIKLSNEGKAKQRQDFQRKYYDKFNKPQLA